MNIESTSSIGTFMTCPKKYYYSYKALLGSRSYMSSLGYGSFVHAFVEQSSGVGRKDAAIQELDRYLKDHPTQESEIREDFYYAENIVGEWAKHWSGDVPLSNNDFTWVASEKEWKFNLGLKMPDRFFAGKSDGLWHSKKFDKVFLYELKTAADRSRDKYIHHLQIDKQISANIIAMESAGISVAGVVYDVVWKPGLIQKKNRKTMPDETNAEFVQRKIDEVKNNAKDYFERTIVFRSDSDIAEFVQDLEAQHSALKHAEVNGFYRNSGACENYNRTCQYFQLCMENSKELEELFIKRNQKLPELSKEIQEK